MIRVIMTSFMVVVTLSVGSSQMNLDRVAMLKGTWQVENKSTFESWGVSGDSLLGEGYKIVNEQKKITEYLRVVEDNGEIIYFATVPNQNQGRSIPFKLNQAEKESISFENPQHDFPKMIQYQKIDTNTLIVRVLGEGGQGFSYRLIRINPAD